MYIKVNYKWQFWLEVAMIVLGTFIMGFAFSIFLEPNEISTGGFSALSMIISELFEKIGVPNVPTFAIYLVLNVVLYGFALKILGKKFAIKALIGILSYSLSMGLFGMLTINLSFELLVSAIYGGACMGVGIGLVVRFGGSTGGSDMIACMVKKKKPNITIGTLMICIDMIIIFLSVITFNDGLRLLPYTIIALVLSMFVTDFVNEGYKQIRAFNIVTTKADELAGAIMDKLSRGCTMMKVKGMHSKGDKYILVCLASRYQAGQLRNIVKEIDPEAFVYQTKVAEVMGEWSSLEEIQKNTEWRNQNKKHSKIEDETPEVKENDNKREIIEQDEPQTVEHESSFGEESDKKE